METLYDLQSLKYLTSWTCQLKKENAQHESFELFYLGQHEDCRTGDRTSDSSEKLLQRGRGKGQ